MSRLQKRPRASEGPDPKLKRRKKVQHRVPDSAGVVTNEDLHWKEVAIPDRLEDAEGFVGLGIEEIDDVEVVKDEDNGGIRFRRRTTTSQRPNVVPPPQRTSEGKSSTHDQYDDSGNEWSGIDDHESASQTITPSTLERDSPDTKAGIQVVGQSQDAKPRSLKGNIGAVQKELESNVSYAILDDVAEAPGTDVSEWSLFPISEEVLSAISNLGFVTPTPIQSAAIPKILQGHDVIGKAVTGSGKTLAYGIPIFEQWLRARRDQRLSSGSTLQHPIALVLAPTRELAHQLAKHISDLTQLCGERPRLATVTGGLSIHKQLRQLSGADIVIGTPGRLWEVMNESQELVSGLKRAQFLVVDEADRLLGEGHFKEMEEILDALDREIVDDNADTGQQAREAQHARQTLVFSATFHKGLQQRLTSKKRPAGGDLLENKQSMDYLLKKLSFRETRPTFIDVNPGSQMAEALNEAILECGAMEKDLFLYYTLLQNPQAKVLVFANSISSVKRLAPLLQNLELPAVALHSTMPQKARLRSLERFSSQRTILVATDVAARGLDIQNIDQIVHYHVPRTADIYVHRSGRTARADRSGKSLMLCSPDEVAGVTRLIGKIHSDYQLQSIQADRTTVNRLRPRLELSQKLTDATLAKEKAGTREDWLRTAAEELGVDYDSDEFEAEEAKSIRGRGAGNNKKKKEAGAVSKGEIASMRAQLKDLLSQRVNLGPLEPSEESGNWILDSSPEWSSFHAKSVCLARLSDLPRIVMAASIDVPGYTTMQIISGCSVICACYVIAVSFYNVFFHPLRRFPGPTLWTAFRLPYVVSLHRGNLHRQMKAFHDRYGQVVRIAPNELSFTDARAWKDIYGNRPGHTPFERNRVWLRKQRLDDPNSIMGPNEEDHSRFRKILTNAFSEKSLKAQAPILQHYVNQLVEQMRAREGESINLVEWLNFCTFDVSGDLSFGESFDCLKDGKPHPWVEISYGFGKGLALVTSISFYPPFDKILRYIIPQKILQRMIDHRMMSKEKVHKRLGSLEQRPDFINTITTQNEGKGAKAMNLKEIELNMSILVFAGSETTASALSGIVRLLLQNPETMRRLSEEVRASFTTESDITIASVARLEYLEAVIDEGIRLCPPSAIGVPRVIPAPGDQVCDLWVPQNTFVAVNQYPTFRSAHNFDRADEFIPERFLSSASPKTFAKNNRTAFQPFGLGRHTCIGQTLAYAEMRLILAKLLFAFNIELTDAADVWDWGIQKTFIFWEKMPLNVRLSSVKY